MVTTTNAPQLKSNKQPVNNNKQPVNTNTNKKANLQPQNKVPSLNVNHAVGSNGITYLQLTNFVKKCGGYNFVKLTPTAKVNKLGTLTTGKIGKTPNLIPLHMPSKYNDDKYLKNGIVPTVANATIKAQVYATGGNTGYLNPVPFGYSGKANGVRMQIQNALLYGLYINSTKTITNNIATILSYASKLGHSATAPICLLALLNGNYTRKQKNNSNATWGLHYITLQQTTKPVK